MTTSEPAEKGKDKDRTVADSEESESESSDVEAGGLPAQAPAAPNASWGIVAGGDWTHEEAQKLRGAKSTILGGCKEIAYGLSFGALTIAANTLLAVSGTNDDNTDEETDNARWVNVGGAIALTGLSVKGLYDIYHGVLTWRETVADHNTRIGAAQEPAQQLLDDSAEGGNQLNSVVIELKGEQKQLEASQGK